MIPSNLTRRLGLCSGGAVKRLRNKIGSVRHCLRHAHVPLLRFLGAKGTENSAVRKLRLSRIGLLRGGKLRPYLRVRQPCLMKT